MANLFLYFRPEKELPLANLAKMHQTLPRKGLLLQTHYLRPFSQKYNGDCLWIGEKDTNEVKKYLKEDKKVFIDSQAIWAPYYLYTGSNFHITSLGKFKENEVNKLFESNCFNLSAVENAEQRIFALNLSPCGVDFNERVFANEKTLNQGEGLVVGKAKPGSVVNIYSTRFFKKLRRERVDYGDLLTWIWAIVSGRNEPLGLTYADKDGFFVCPIKSSETDFIDVKGENVDSVQKLAS